MRRELLVNATPPETRVAATEDGKTVEVLHERRGHQGLVGNVYLARVHRILPGMHAAFVSLGLERDGFLYVEDLLPRSVEADDEETEAQAGGPAPGWPSGPDRIEDLLREGQDIVVQVTKDALSGKGPRVTANIALPGRMLVCLPGAGGVGVSRRITDEAERERLRRILEGFGPGAGWIARTAAGGGDMSGFLADKGYLEDLASRIRAKSEKASGPLLLHRELDLALRSVRDLVTPDFAAIRVDDGTTLDRIVEFLNAAAPKLAPRVELYEGAEPLFDRFGVEREIESALKSRVHLSSGGSVVIHQTEALVAIDVNTGKFVGSDALEETVFATNLEAVGRDRPADPPARPGRHPRRGLHRHGGSRAPPRGRRGVPEGAGQGPRAHAPRPDLGVRAGRADPPALARQPREDPDPPLPLLRRQRPREDGPLGRPGPAA